MPRGLIAIGLSLALPGGALCASLVHAHLDDHHRDHHDGPRIVHAHLSGHLVEQHGWPAGTRALGSDSESGRTTYLQVFLAVHSETAIDPGLPPVGFVLPPVPESVMRQAPDIVRSHGPPEGRPSEPRAPPAFLS